MSPCPPMFCSVFLSRCLVTKRLQTVVLESTSPTCSVATRNRSLATQTRSIATETSSLATQTRSLATGARATTFGLLLDIDGVLIRGSKTVEGTIDAFRKLSDESGNLNRPIVFLTNGSARSEAAKATELSERLGAKIDASQIVLVDSPLRLLSEWHSKSVFFAGQGEELADVARDLGFSHPVTLQDVLCDIPMFDVISHKNRAALKSGDLPNSLPSYFPIEGIVVSNTPVNWDAHIQFLLDLLLSNGTLSRDTTQHIDTCQLPVIACNPDLVWASEYHMPRLACGAFIHALSSLYREMRGRELQVEWCGKPTRLTYEYARRALHVQCDKLGLTLDTIYGVGDNVDVDVVGANNNGAVSVLVCTGLYERRSSGAVEKDVVVQSKRASVQDGIRVDILCDDFSSFVQWLLP